MYEIKRLSKRSISLLLYSLILLFIETKEEEERESGESWRYPQSEEEEARGGARSLEMV